MSATTVMCCLAIIFDIIIGLVSRLYYHWLEDNHNKYAAYFIGWYNNITISQINGFTDQMYRELNFIKL